MLPQLKSRLAESNKLTTGQVRAISADLFRQLPSRHIDYVLPLAEQFLEERTWAPGVVAYDWAYRVRKGYSESTFDTFERWLKTYVTGWGDCDDFCTHAFGALLAQHGGTLFPRLVAWTQDPNFAVRRAAAVSLIYPIKKRLDKGLDPFLIADRLMHDSHYLVLKGYGWMLKELSEVNPDIVYDYLQANRHHMPRTAFRYALEKLDPDRRAALMGMGGRSLRAET